MPILKCLSPYSSWRGGEWKEGHEEEVTDEQAEFLLADSPDSFELVKPAKPARKPGKARS